MEERKNTLLSIYGAKVSKDGKKLVLTLVQGEDDNKTYYSACVKLDNTQKTHVKVGKTVAQLQIPLLKEDGSKKATKKQKKDEDTVTNEEDVIPF